MSRYRRGMRWERSGHIMGSRRHPYRYRLDRGEILKRRYAWRMNHKSPQSLPDEGTADEQTT